ncbi:MAG: ABC transporter ATP-binding protein [Lachnospiraceae bacterium]|jgi:ABC-2 type transport system ATP-binding protein|nr:ABC transporter ATP-binding protein [Lachnospiraceae bacterium]
MNIVTLNSLSKTYPGGKKAVDSLNINLEKGEVFGFLGPNGAGKTTTVKLLNGMLSPTEGSCRIFGIDPTIAPEKLHALVGVVTEHAQMYQNLTGIQNLVFYGSVFGLSTKESEKRGLDLLERLELSDARDKKLSSYSTGMRQRLSLARSLIHRPQILFLDEPTSGLDPESAQNVHTMIRNLAKDHGITVFLCTHQLRYAQEICTRYGLMENGRLIAEGTFHNLRSSVCPGMKIKLKAQGVPSDLPCRKIGNLAYEVEIESEKDIPQIVRKIVEAGGEIYHVSAELPTLEDIYFTLTRKKEGSI